MKKIEELFCEFYPNYRTIICGFLELLKIKVLAGNHAMGRLPIDRLEEINRKKKDVFKNETFLVFKSLFDFYECVSIKQDATVIEGITRRVLITYKTNFCEGVKIGGKYRVIINAGGIKSMPIFDSLLKLVSVEKPPHIKKSSSFIHPHVNNDSRICWGGFSDIVAKLMAEAAFLEVLLTSHRFLSSANLGSCYSKGNFLELREFIPKNKTRKNKKR